jgi:hypothetical protein
VNRHDLLALKAVNEYPAVTVTMPTHRTSPDNKQDPVRLKNLVREARERLIDEKGKRPAQNVVGRLDALADSVDINRNLDGLGLFVSDDVARVHRVPFTLPERVVVDETFLTRDMVFALNRSPRYWTIVLTENATRLFEGIREDLVEVESDGFPLSHEGPGGATNLPGGFGKRRSAHRDERHRQFFRGADDALKAFTTDDPLPLAVIGVDRYLAFFDEVSSHRESIVARVEGSHDTTSAHELGKLVWPPAEEALAAERAKIFDELDRAIGQRRSASTIAEVWRMAEDGRGRVLVVEQDFHYPAKVDETGRHLGPADAADAGREIIDDAVDDVIETVLAKGGRVVFVDNGTLEKHSRIALLLRY